MKVRFGTRLIDTPQLNAYIVSSMKMMKSMGLVPGERVALYDSNTVEYALLLICFCYMRIVACPINPKTPLKRAQEYASALGIKHFLTRTEIKKAIAFDARQQLYAPDALPVLNPDQEAVIIATSGSTGEPKPAVLSIGQFMANARGSKATIPFSNTDGWLLSLPLYHVSGIAIIIRCLEADATLVVAVAEDIMDDMNRPAVTHVSLVATQLYRLLQQPQHIDRLRQLKAILLGGSSIPVNLLDQAVKASLPVYISYGLTEMASQVATGRVVDPHLPCAKVLPYRQVCINHDGEILVRGETLFKGYVIGQRLHLPLTVIPECFNRESSEVGAESWFSTGDIGTLDPNGYLTVLGRRDNMFICAGENIHPEEIEKVLQNIVGVKQAMVVAKPDKEYGNRPIAFVDREGQFNSAELVQLCRSFLPAIKVPAAFYPWPNDQLTLKPSRKTLTALAGTLQAG